jgi:hypothetical protein
LLTGTVSDAPRLGSSIRSCGSPPHQNTEVAVSPFAAASAGYRRTSAQKFFLARHAGIRVLIIGHLARNNQKFIFLSKTAFLISGLAFIVLQNPPRGLYAPVFEINRDTVG